MRELILRTTRYCRRILVRKNTTAAARRGRTASVMAARRALSENIAITHPTMKVQESRMSTMLQAIISERRPVSLMTRAMM